MSARVGNMYLLYIMKRGSGKFCLAIYFGEDMGEFWGKERKNCAKVTPKRSLNCEKLKKDV